MSRTFGLGLAFVLLSASVAPADPTCATGTWQTLSNGNVADASQVMTNFNCLAVNPSLNGVGGQNANTSLSAYTTGATQRAQLNLRKSASNTVGTLAPSADGDWLGLIAFWGVTSGGSWSDDTASIGVTQYGAAGATRVGGNLVFNTGDGTAGGVARMTIRGDGRVGIGTTTPVAPINVIGSGATAVLQNTSSTGYAGLRVYNDLNSSARALEIDYSGTSFSGSLVPSGPTGESAAISVVGAYPLVLATSNTARLTIASDGKVGIGTNAPVGNLDVYGSGNTNGLRLTGATSGNGPVVAARGGDSNITLTLQSLGTGAITLMTGGGAQVKVGNTASAENWMVLTGGVAANPGIVSVIAAGISTNISIGLTPKGTGNVVLNGQVLLNALGSATATNLCINSTLISSCSSSIRYKESISSASFGLKEVLAMRPVTFKWKGRDEKDFGFIAEEISKINPLFATYKDGRIEGVKYPQMTAVLVNAVKELKAANDAQAAEVLSLRKLNQRQAREADTLRYQQVQQAAELQELRSAIVELKRDTKMLTAQR